MQERAVPETDLISSLSHLKPIAISDPDTYVWNPE